MFKVTFTLCALFLLTEALDKEVMEAFFEELQEVGSKCVPETGATDEDIGVLLNHEVPTTHTGQCLIYCFHKHFNIMTPEGKLNPAGALQSIERIKEHDLDLYNTISNVFKTCGVMVQVDTDPCITAGRLATCALVEGKKAGLSASIFEM